MVSNNTRFFWKLKKTIKNNEFNENKNLMLRI